MVDALSMPAWHSPSVQSSHSVRIRSAPAEVGAPSAPPAQPANTSGSVKVSEVEASKRAPPSTVSTFTTSTHGSDGPQVSDRVELSAVDVHSAVPTPIVTRPRALLPPAKVGSPKRELSPWAAEMATDGQSPALALSAGFES